MKKFLTWVLIGEYTYAAWMTDMRISQESISDQLFKKGDAVMGERAESVPEDEVARCCLRKDYTGCAAAAKIP